MILPRDITKEMNKVRENLEKECKKSSTKLSERLGFQSTYKRSKSQQKLLACFSVNPENIQIKCVKDEKFQKLFTLGMREAEESQNTPSQKHKRRSATSLLCSPLMNMMMTDKKSQVSELETIFAHFVIFRIWHQLNQSMMMMKVIMRILMMLLMKMVMKQCFEGYQMFLLLH